MPAARTFGSRDAPRTYRIGTSGGLRPSRSQERAADYPTGPDFEAEAKPLRPLFRTTHRHTETANRARLRALVASRGFLVRARLFKAKFYRDASESGIKGGSTETRVVRFLYQINVRSSRTVVGMWGDALGWLVDNCPGRPDAEAIEHANSIGGLTELAKRYRTKRQSPDRIYRAAIRAAPSFIDRIIEKLDPYEPDDSPPEPNTISVRIERVDNSGKPHLYARIMHEDLIERALAAMQRTRP